ncbi:hypothetical protein LWI29_033717 [Acer saccharum]|uniref:DUF4283 domain-containing protein n=1 Tax=Acer saccharum TaxID=4024 RepID=A0AA39RTX7_ACESA|nr:hypothetical protein LWI29_033717 [Acer saccharum]
MSNCSDWWTPKGKLAWINAIGISLSCWEEAFFLKLGSLFGEMLWIDKETLSRKRLDQAKFLALIPHDWHNSFNTKIIMEESSFEVKIEVGPNPVSSSWLNQILDLEETLSESFFIGVHGLREVDKGKGPWVRVQRPKELPLFYQNAKIIIRKIKCQTTKKVAVISTSFSSSSDSMGPVMFKGECSSKSREDGLLKSGLSEYGLGDSLMGSSSDSSVDGLNNPVNKDPKHGNVT